MVDPLLSEGYCNEIKWKKEKKDISMWELSLLTRLRDTHMIIDQRKSALMGNFSTNCLKVENNNLTNKSHRSLVFIDNTTTEILATEAVAFNFLDYKVFASHWHSKTVVIQGVLKKI